MLYEIRLLFETPRDELDVVEEVMGELVTDAASHLYSDESLAMVGPPRDVGDTDSPDELAKYKQLFEDAVVKARGDVTLG